MQSGFAKSEYWVLEYEPEASKGPEPLMGWTSSGDTLGQVIMKFPTLKDAKHYADSKGLVYSVTNAHKRKIKPRNYGDNFRYVPPEEEKA